MIPSVPPSPPVPSGVRRRPPCALGGASAGRPVLAVLTECLPRALLKVAPTARVDQEGTWPEPQNPDRSTFRLADEPVPDIPPPPPRRAFEAAPPQHRRPVLPPDHHPRTRGLQPGFLNEITVHIGHDDTAGYSPETHAQMHNSSLSFSIYSILLDKM